MEATEGCAALAGLKFLVDMRADLQDTIHETSGDSSKLRALSEALRCVPSVVPAWSITFVAQLQL